MFFIFLAPISSVRIPAFTRPTWVLSYYAKNQQQQRQQKARTTFSPFPPQKRIFGLPTTLSGRKISPISLSLSLTLFCLFSIFYFFEGFLRFMIFFSILFPFRNRCLLRENDQFSFFFLFFFFFEIDVCLILYILLKSDYSSLLSNRFLAFFFFPFFFFLFFFLCVRVIDY